MLMHVRENVTFKLSAGRKKEKKEGGGEYSFGICSHPVQQKNKYPTRRGLKTEWQYRPLASLNI